MEFSSTTEKIAKGYGYLVPSALARVLNSAGVEIETHLVRRNGTPRFDVHFWPPNPDVPYERLYIVAGTAPTTELRELSREVELIVLPRFVAWIGNILSLDSNSPIRRERQQLSFSFSSDA